jgi:hypothetical protein
MKDDYGLTMFLWAFGFGLFCISVIQLIFADVGLTLFLISCIFVVSALWGIGTSKQDVVIKSWAVIICTVDDGSYYLGRDLSWNDAKKLRDATVKVFNDPKESMVSVKCWNSGGRYGVRNFVKSNIVHIGWLED